MPGYLSTSSASASMPVYSTSAQRNSSVSFPYIGQMTYISSTGKIEFWNGSSWVISNQDAIQPQDPISIYASAAARDAALPSPTEGKLVYLSDTNVIQVYNGITWDNLGSGSDINPLSVAGM